MPSRKVPDSLADEIRRLYAETADQPIHVRKIELNPDRWTYPRLAERFAISARTVEKIVRGEPPYDTKEEEA